MREDSGPCGAASQRLTCRLAMTTQMGTCVTGPRSLRRVLGRVLPASSRRWGLQASLGSWPHRANLCLAGSPARVASVSSFLSLVIGLGPIQIIQDKILPRSLN